MSKKEDIEKLVKEHMPSAEDLKAADESGAKILVLSRGHTIDGEPRYTYLSVPPSKLIPLKMAELEGGFRYEDFGEILASGEGLEPPEDVMKMMEEEHGFDHAFEDKVIEKGREIEKKQSLLAKYTGKKDS